MPENKSVPFSPQNKEIMNKKVLCLVKLIIGLAFLVGASATAWGEEFYQGKTILFIVSYGPGGRLR